MNSEGNPVAGEPPPRVGEEGDGGRKAAGAFGAGERNGDVKWGVVGRHERNGSMSGAFLDAPGYSPSFASFDRSSFESQYGSTYSETFEGFETPRMSNSSEVSETPNVTRPEELSFTALEGEKKSPEFTELGDPKEGQVLKDHFPVANLVESHPGDDAAMSPPTELKPTLGNVDESTFGVLPKPPGSSNVPYVTQKKIPGYELLSSVMNKPSTPVTREDSHGVVDVNPLVVGARRSVSGHSNVTSQLEELKEEPKPVVLQSEPEAAHVAQPRIHEAPLPAMAEPAVVAPAMAELVVAQRQPDAAHVQPTIHQASLLEGPAVAVSATEKLDSYSVHSPVAPTADGSRIEKGVDASNVATGSEGKIEEAVDKSAGHGIDTSGEKEVGSVKPAETIAFHNVEAVKEVSTSTSTGTIKPGPIGKLTTISTKKWRAPTDADLKAMVTIPEYLSKDMANAVATKGTAYPEGPPAGGKIEAPTCPILVFINSKSGGRLGSELMQHFEELISPNQVYDLAKHSPSAVLQYGLGCLERMANSGDECARRTRDNLRILVAGGDGTVGWVLSSVGALRELSGTTSIPPVGVIPLGTGNDLSRSFGWGGDFSSTNKSALKRVLVKALGSQSAPLDTWNVVVMPAKSVAANSIEFPHAMHPQHHVPLPSSVAGQEHDKDEKAPAFEGLFFNYFSVGMDAQVAYGFHHLRDEKPWLARGRTANQIIYSGFGCTQGWFCTACTVAPRARGISNILKLSVKKRGSKDWHDIHLPSNIRAIVICNLHSYAGGRNPWGKPSSGTREKEGFEEQKPDDGLLEIMGLKDGWHSAFVLLEVSTAVRLCQAEAVKLEFNGNARKKAYLQMDGEPWMQPLGMPDAEPTVVMIEKLPHPSLLLKR